MRWSSRITLKVGRYEARMDRWSAGCNRYILVTGNCDRGSKVGSIRDMVGSVIVIARVRVRVELRKYINGTGGNHVIVSK